MGIKTLSNNDQQPKSQPQQDDIAVSPDVLINSLIQRVQQLTMENVMKDAVIAQLQSEAANGVQDRSPVGVGAEATPQSLDENEAASL